MAVARCLQLCLLLSLISLIWGQNCMSVNDVLPSLPQDLQKLIKSRIDVFAFKGSVFLPTETAWKNRDLSPSFFGEEALKSILDFSIIPGVRFAERPQLKTGTESLESKFKDKGRFFCLTADKPDNKIDVELVVTGKPSADDTQRFALSGTAGNKYKAGKVEIEIVKVYSEIALQNLPMTKQQILELDAMRDGPADKLKKIDDKKRALYQNITEIASWVPAKVVKVVQCQTADVFFVDHLLLPCPLCGKTCDARLVEAFSLIMLPGFTVLAVGLAVAGYVAVCIGCTACAGQDGVCGTFWKCICRSLVFIILALELLIIANFAVIAWYIHDFEKKQVSKGQKEKWTPYFIWAVVGAVLTALVLLSQVWSFISGARKRNERKHQPFMSSAPPPMYTPVGATPPMRA